MKKHPMKSKVNQVMRRVLMHSGPMTLFFKGVNFKTVYGVLQEIVQEFYHLTLLNFVLNQSQSP